MEILGFPLAVVVAGLAIGFVAWVDAPRGRAVLRGLGAWFPAVLWIGAVAVVTAALVVLGDPDFGDPGAAGVWLGAALVVGPILAAVLGTMAWARADDPRTEPAAPVQTVPGRPNPLWLRLAGLALALAGIATSIRSGLAGDVDGVVRNAAYVIVFLSMVVLIWSTPPVAVDGASEKFGALSRPWARAAALVVVLALMGVMAWRALEGDWEPLARTGSLAGIFALLLYSQRRAQAVPRHA